MLYYRTHGTNLAAHLSKMSEGLLCPEAAIRFLKERFPGLFLDRELEKDQS